MFMTAFIDSKNFIRFTVVKSLPCIFDSFCGYVVGLIEPVKIYDWQLYDNVHDYSYFKISMVGSDETDWLHEIFVCIRKDDENETVNE